MTFYERSELFRKYPKTPVFDHSNYRLFERIHAVPGTSNNRGLTVLVLEALSREFNTGVPWELLYADDLAVIADTLEECITKLKAWKNGMENRGLRVNMNKTKFMISGAGLDVLRDSGAFPWAVCRSAVGANYQLFPVQIVGP